jgi:hypothetical protein
VASTEAETDEAERRSSTDDSRCPEKVSGNRGDG